MLIRLHFQAKKRSQIFSLVTDDDNIRKYRQNGSYLILYQDRRNIFTSSCNDKFFDSSCNCQVTLGIDFTDISRMNKSLAVDCWAGLFLVFKVPHESISTYKLFI